VHGAFGYVEVAVGVAVVAVVARLMLRRRSAPAQTVER
jgi:hypothetical protein